MTTIKSYTDIEQSKKLAKILPIESADMYYAYYHNPVSGASYYEEYPMFYKPICNPNESVPCWSLAALLNVLQEYHLSSPNPLSSMHCCRVNDIETYANNQVDACYDLILKLNELKML